MFEFVFECNTRQQGWPCYKALPGSGTDDISDFYQIIAIFDDLPVQSDCSGSSETTVSFYSFDLGPINIVSPRIHIKKGIPKCAQSNLSGRG